MPEKVRFEQIERNATAVKQEASVLNANGDYRYGKNREYYRRVLITPQEFIFIGSTVDIGTARVRANHRSAFLDLFEEQITLHKAGVPI